MLCRLWDDVAGVRWFLGNVYTGTMLTGYLCMYYIRQDHNGHAPHGKQPHVSYVELRHNSEEQLVWVQTHALRLDLPPNRYPIDLN